MKKSNKFKIATLIVVSIFMGKISSGQNKYGGFGYFTFGVSPTNINGLESDLKNENRFGSGFTFNSMGISFGGGGYSRVGKSFLIGGNGFGTLFSNSQNSKADLEISQGGGFCNIGYIVLQNEQWFGFPYLGIGGGGITMVVSNKLETDFNFTTDEKIAPKETRNYSSGGIAFDLGFSIKRLFIAPTESGWGGPMIGLDAGVYLMPFNDSWVYDGTKKSLNGFSKPDLTAIYVKLNIGFGGWGIYN